MKRILFSLACTLVFTSCVGIPEGVVFKKADYGEKWPFSVDQIEVYCSGIAKSEIYFRSGDKVYALNGDARTMARTRRSAETFDDVDQVWLDDPKYPGTKIVVPQEFISKAFENCK